ncbi:hypothetical protein MNB_SUP05-6-191 [hydrothermal vent metagenome]|uniref:Uncharacterized protein n=1 Tax=hydrothermal vent metagenome TaxID=652676 RepID=A0A1W1DMT4_9ZZZZ
MVESCTALATACTAAKSPGDAMAKPASITSTFIFSNTLAMRTFSSLVIDAPGDCSPSRSVVSKIISLSDIFVSCICLFCYLHFLRCAGLSASRDDRLPYGNNRNKDKRLCLN